MRYCMTSLKPPEGPSFCLRAESCLRCTSLHQMFGISACNHRQACLLIAENHLTNRCMCMLEKHVAVALMVATPEPGGDAFEGPTSTPSRKACAISLSVTLVVMLLTYSVSAACWGGGSAGAAACFAASLRAQLEQCLLQCFSIVQSLEGLHLFILCRA